MKLIYAEEVLYICYPFLEDGDDYVENTAQSIMNAVKSMPQAEAIPISFLMSYAEQNSMYQPMLTVIHAWDRYNGKGDRNETVY